MTLLYNHPAPGAVEDVDDFPPPFHTHLIEKYLLQVVDDLHKDPWAHRRFHKCPSRRLKITTYLHEWGPPGNAVPRINLMGKWLSNAGFAMQQHVRVFTLKKALVICLDEDDIRNDISK